MPVLVIEFCLFRVFYRCHLLKDFPQRRCHIQGQCFGNKIYISEVFPAVGYFHTAGFKNRRGIFCAKCISCPWHFHGLVIQYCVLFESYQIGFNVGDRYTALSHSRSAEDFTTQEGITTSNNCDSLGNGAYIYKIDETEMKEAGCKNGGMLSSIISYHVASYFSKLKILFVANPSINQYSWSVTFDEIADFALCVWNCIKDAPYDFKGSKT